MPPRVVLTRQLPADSAARLTAAGCEIEVLGGVRVPTHDDLLHAVRGADALVCLLADRVDAEVLDAGAPTLRIVANVAVGVDNIDLAAAAERGVTVTNTPGVLDAATADLAILLLLAVRRRLLEAVLLLRSGAWEGFAIDGCIGHDLEGTTLGIIGYGRIGRKVALRAKAFDMHVLHHSRTPTGEPGYVAELDELLEACGAVSLHVPLTPDTHHLLDARRLGLLPPGATFVNTSRGAVVDEEALADLLVSGRLGGAGLDVFASEPEVNPRLLDAPNVVLTPHVGSATAETRQRMCDLAVDGVLAALAGDTPVNVVGPGRDSGAKG